MCTQQCHLNVPSSPPSQVFEDDRGVLQYIKGDQLKNTIAPLKFVFVSARGSDVQLGDIFVNAGKLMYTFTVPWL